MSGPDFGNVMKGGGHYNNNSAPQGAAVEVSLSLIREAMQHIKFAVPSHQPVYIADLGSSQGKNSLAPIGVLIEEIRRLTHGDAQDYKDMASPSIVVVHEDLPSNDFSALFSLVQSTPTSYLHQYPNVFVLASGRSFYHQLLPDSSLHIAFSATAMHWLSARPALLPDHVSSCRTQDAVARQAYEEQARKDWQTILRHRGRELVSGGLLMTIQLWIPEAGRVPAYELVDAIERVAVELRDEGTIDAASFLELSFLDYYRQLPEFLDADVLQESGFEVISHTPLPSIPNPIYKRYSNTGDIEAFGKAMAGFIQSWSYFAVSSALKEESKIQLFYDRLALEFSKQPDLYQFNSHIFICFRKL
eukprot:TRINITY_DN613_c0_g1_i12.p1 TRINITY_DN613_c0_g1~~TRINITY_DN613_c0_g1_i12.p1  ORF type:complete len:360 (-),score=76.91 TRINITY_DN613_c0_g1_i12:136-1215(-)